MARDNSPERTNDDTRGRIVAAALVLFAEKGFDATSIREIATAAKCNTAGVNYHFGSKAGLYSEAIVHLLGDLRDLFIERVLDSGNLAHKDEDLDVFLERFVAVGVEMIHSVPYGRSLFLYCYHEIHSRGVPPQILSEEFIQPLVNFTRDQLANWYPSITTSSARLCLISLWSQLTILARFNSIADQEGPPLAFRMDQTELVSHIICFSAAGIRRCLRPARR